MKTIYRKLSFKIATPDGLGETQINADLKITPVKGYWECVRSGTLGVFDKTGRADSPDEAILHWLTLSLRNFSNWPKVCQVATLDPQE